MIKYLLLLLPSFCTAQDFIYPNSIFLIPIKEGHQCKFSINEQDFYVSPFSPNKVDRVYLIDGRIEVCIIYLFYITEPDQIEVNGYIYQRDHYAQSYNMFAPPIFHDEEKMLEFACGYYRKIGRKNILIDWVGKPIRA